MKKYIVISLTATMTVVVFTISIIIIIFFLDNMTLTKKTMDENNSLKERVEYLETLIETYQRNNQDWDILGDSIEAKRKLKE